MRVQRQRVKGGRGAGFGGGDLDSAAFQNFLFKGSRLFLVNVKNLVGGELSLSACPRGGEYNIN